MGNKNSNNNQKHDDSSDDGPENDECFDDSEEEEEQIILQDGAEREDDIANRASQLIDTAMANKIKSEIASIPINYGPPQSSLFGGNANGGSSDQRLNSAGESITDINVSDASSQAQEVTICLLKFDTFLSLFTMITRYSKQLKLPSLQRERQKLYREADWDGYRLLVLQQLAFEKESHDAIMEFVLNNSQVEQNIFGLSHQKYQLNRMCAEQMQGSVLSLNRVEDRTQLTQGRKLLLTLDDAKKPSQQLIMATLKAIEQKKAETLSDLSNPFKAAREKHEIVLDLECAKAKITDYIEVDQVIKSEQLFNACCHHYGLMKSQEELNDPDRDGISRDAMVIRNNAR